ncbi:hypothetical protein [Flavobacterium adhaerens]|uniref:hypothetical protein n=1 Tax=Flavobacterium adhaerens TaxID=3149043 RepID=UPI0032B49319
MSGVWDKIEKKLVSGLVLLLPILVFIAVLQKFWSFFQKYGDKVAKLFHLDKILGEVAKDLLGGFFLLLLIYLSGYLVTLAFFKSFSDWIDDKLMVFIPGYEKQKKIAEAKLNSRTSTEKPIHVPILFKMGDYWQPGYLIDESDDGNVVVYLPVAPKKDSGQIYIATLNDIKRLSETTIGELDNSIKNLGKGMLDFK